jgi:CBS domain-containing protein
MLTPLSWMGERLSAWVQSEVRPGKQDEAIRRRSPVAKTVRDAMTAAVRAASPTDSLADAAQLMKQEDVGSLPVVEGGRLIGIVTDRDIVVRAIAERVDPQSVRVAEVASHEVVTVESEQDLDEALNLMARHRVRRLPVVQEGKLVGVLAQADIAIEVDDKKAGEMLEEISQPGTGSTM